MSGNTYIKNPKIIAELKRLVRKHHGLLLPETLVDEARPVSSPVHKQFTWDNTEAGNKWRIEEARRLLQVTVEYVKRGKEEVSYRAFCSLTTDRRDGGYRAA